MEVIVYRNPLEKAIWEAFDPMYILYFIIACGLWIPIQLYITNSIKKFQIPFMIITFILSMFISVKLINYIILL